MGFLYSGLMLTDQFGRQLRIFIELTLFNCIILLPWAKQVNTQHEPTTETALMFCAPTQKCAPTLVVSHCAYCIVTTYNL